MRHHVTRRGRRPVSVCLRPAHECRPAVRTAGRSQPLLRGPGGWRALLAGAGWAGWCACGRVRHPHSARCDSRAVVLCAVLITVHRPTRVKGMKVLVTGGAGYIGSTTAKALEEAGHTPVILDSLLPGRGPSSGDRIFYEGDIADRGAAAPGSSRSTPTSTPPSTWPRGSSCPSRSSSPTSTTATTSPSRWSSSTSSSSSASRGCCSRRPRRLYAAQATSFEVTEDDPLDPPSPYARTKRMMEQVLQDMAAATDLRAIILRYFNPIGSDPDLESGIYAKEPSHVLGQLVMAARGPEGRLHDHRHRPPDPRRHRHPRLHPRLGPRPGARRGGRAVRRRARGGGRRPSAIINVGTGDGCHRARAGRGLREGLRPGGAGREAPPRPGDAVGAYANVDRRARCSAGAASPVLEDAIDSALAWGEKRQEILGYE